MLVLFRVILRLLPISLLCHCDASIAGHDNDGAGFHRLPPSKFPLSLKVYFHHYFCGTLLMRGNGLPHRAKLSDCRESISLLIHASTSRAPQLPPPNSSHHASPQQSSVMDNIERC